MIMFYVLDRGCNLCETDTTTSLDEAWSNSDYMIQFKFILDNQSGYPLRLHSTGKELSIFKLSKKSSLG